MSSRDHSSPSQQAATKTTLIENITEKLEYLHVSTTTSGADTPTKHNDFNNQEAETNIVAWSGSTTRLSPSKTVHTTAPSTIPNQVPQPLLQLMPPTSPSTAVMSSEQAYFYMNSAYYPQSYGYSSNNYQYQYPGYIPAGWPMTNINFMPNLFLMPGNTQSQNPGFVMPPPMPLLKQPFGPNRRFQNNRTQSESSRNGRNGNGNGSASSSFTNRQSNHRRQGSKTALCRNISDYGQCSYGERCYFAHSADELKPKPTNTKYKTVNCTAFVEKGSCPYRDKCHFIHPSEDDRPPTDPLRR